MYKEILVPLDGSEFAEAALSHARALATAFTSRVTLISIVESFSISPQPGIIGPVITVGVDIEEDMQQSRDYIHVIAEDLRQLGIEVKEFVNEGDPGSGISKYADEHGIDLIVMSTHGRSGIQKFVYGSVAEKILHNAKVPILLVRSFKKES